MTDARSDLTNPQRRLPDLELPALGEGAPVKIRSRGRTAALVALLHGADCAQCTSYLHQLAERHDDIVDADGRVIAVMSERADRAGSAGPASEPAGDENATDPSVPFPILLDREQRLAAALDVPPPAIVTADQWGAVHSVDAAGSAHSFPRVDELLASLNYLSIQCPECEGESL